MTRTSHDRKLTPRPWRGEDAVGNRPGRASVILSTMRTTRPALFAFAAVGVLLVAGCSSGEARSATSTTSRRSTPTTGLSTTTTSVAAAGAASGVNQRLLHQCEAQHGLCMNTVPGLAACVAARKVCDVQEYQALLRSRAETSRAAGGRPMSRSEAIARALSGDPNATASSPVFAKEMSLNEYNRMSGETLTEPGIPSARVEVWAVTVHAPMLTDGSPASPGVVKNAYTVVFDTVTRWGLETCIGCATLG